MSPNVTLDPDTQAKLIDFVKKRLGLLGAYNFKKEANKCTCGPCVIFRAIVSGADIPEQP